MYEKERKLYVPSRQFHISHHFVVVFELFYLCVFLTKVETLLYGQAMIIHQTINSCLSNKTDNRFFNSVAKEWDWEVDLIIQASLNFVEQSFLFISSLKSIFFCYFFLN